MVVKLLVTAVGIVLAVLVNWYFLFSKKKRTRSELDLGIHSDHQ